MRTFADSPALPARNKNWNPALHLLVLMIEEYRNEKDNITLKMESQNLGNKTIYGEKGCIY